MNNPILAGNFESTYTIKNDDGELDTIDDQISFVIVDGTQGNGFRGEGIVADDGLKMKLILKNMGAHIQGTWGEYDQEDQEVHGGQVEFVSEGADKFIGMWTMKTTVGEGQQEISTGTWMLRKALGNTALNVGLS